MLFPVQHNALHSPQAQIRIIPSLALGRSKVCQVADTQRVQRGEEGERGARGDQVRETEKVRGNKGTYNGEYYGHLVTFVLRPPLY